MPKRLHRLGIAQSGLNDHPDPRACQHVKETDKDTNRDEDHKDLVSRNRVSGDREGGKLQNLGCGVSHLVLAPDKLHQFLDQQRQTKGKDKFRHMAILVDAPETVSLNPGAHHTNDQGCDQKPHPEPQRKADLVGKIGA